jgi:long-chain acyl-CoA synthetase
MNKSKPALAEVFYENAARLCSKLAVRERGREWSYTELLARSEDLSRFLTSLGISAGHRVGLMLPNSGAFVACFFGIARVGGVIAPLSTRYRIQELSYYLKDTSASAILVAPDTVVRAKEALDQNEHPPFLVEVRPDGSFKILQEGEVDTAPIPDSDDSPLLHQYTSGSTGNPKRVIRTHGKLLWELERLAKVFHLGESDRSHVNGLVRTMMTSMFVGGTLYPVPEFKRREVLKLITQEEITYFGAVPYMYVFLATTPLRGEVDLSSIRTAFSSSAPLLADDNRLFANKYGFFVRQLYGSTETGTISVNTDPNLGECLESVGLPLDGIRVEIFDDECKPLPAGQQGEVAISSPAAITAYDNNPEANAKSFENEFYLSGDLGFKDERGYLTLTGRKKFLINRGGYEVNPFEVMQAIMSHPKVREVAVFGAPTHHGDQLIRCVIVANAPCTEGEIIEHCQSRIADYKIPGIVDFAKELPKSQTGKILHHKLK